MQYISTRGNSPAIESAQAIMLGMVPRGGLFIPENLPTLATEELLGLNYQELAFAVLLPFFGGKNKNYSEEEIKSFIAAVYTSEKFDDPQITPLTLLDEKTAALELWHGPTAAFKDVALQIMPYFLKAAAKKLGSRKETVILVATSGDTGKAALEGFKDVEGAKIIVFYPKDGVSKMQELQMLSTTGKNTSVVGVEGNFDDCQNMVKEIFSDDDFNTLMSFKGFQFSSANSINWGRLAPQIVYYFRAYLEMVRKNVVKMGDVANAVVPTGNFGNILAGFYAKKMGLPIQTLICASNQNHVLSDFIQTGVYDRKRKFFKTSSPSMDILISSNLERLLFEITKHNAFKINRWYEDLFQKGEFKLDDNTKNTLKNLIYGDFASESETRIEIKRVFEKYRYLIDPHTAVGFFVLEKYRAQTEDEAPAFVCATASPYKFNQAVYQAITGDDSLKDEFIILEKLAALNNGKPPASLMGLKEAPILHKRVINKREGRKVIGEILGISIGAVN